MDEQGRSLRVMESLIRLIGGGAGESRLLRVLCEVAAQELDASYVLCLAPRRDGRLAVRAASFPITASRRKEIAAVLTGACRWLDPVRSEGAVTGAAIPGGVLRLAGADRLDPRGTHAYAAVPWGAGGRRLGILLAGGPRHGEEFLVSDLRMLEGISRALAMVHVLLEVDRRERRIGRSERLRVLELELMQEASSRLAATAEPAAIEQTVAEITDRAIRLDSHRRFSVSFGRVLGGRLEYVCTVPEGQPPWAGLEFQIESHPMVVAAFRTGQVQTARIADLSFGDPSLQVRFGGRPEWAAWAPVLVDGRPYGVLVVREERRSPFLDQDLHRLVAMAKMAELAIGNAKHLEEVRSEARRMAQLEKAKRDFLDLASHELRGPLAAIRGYLAMLGDGTLDGRPAEVRRALEVIEARAAEMDRLLSQMVDVARLESGRIELRLETIDLNQLVGSVIDRSLPVSDRHQVELQPAPVPALVDGDAQWLKVILRNLVDNAVKYSPDGGRVTCRVRSRPGGWAVDVTDQGIGISPDDQPRLFQRFSRVGDASGPAIPGIGLGLYLSRQLARRHGGDLIAGPADGGGATFTLLLPNSPDI